MTRKKQNLTSCICIKLSTQQFETPVLSRRLFSVCQQNKEWSYVWKHSPALRRHWRDRGECMLCQGGCWRLHNGLWEHIYLSGLMMWEQGGWNKKHWMCHRAHRSSTDNNTNWQRCRRSTRSQRAQPDTCSRPELWRQRATQFEYNHTLSSHELLLHVWHGE